MTFKLLLGCGTFYAIAPEALRLAISETSAAWSAVSSAGDVTAAPFFTPPTTEAVAAGTALGVPGAPAANQSDISWPKAKCLLVGRTVLMCFRAASYQSRISRGLQGRSHHPGHCGSG